MPAPKTSPIRIAASLVVLAFAAAALTAAAPPAPAPTSAAPATAPAKPRWPAPLSYLVGPGLRGLADGSDAIVLAEVTETSPHVAIEGARDNARFKVIRTFLGTPREGDPLALYYHIDWSDETRSKTEPRIQLGKRYILFLKKPGQQLEWELADDRLGIMLEQPRLADEVVEAVRVMYGDTHGGWGPDRAAFRGRLVMVRDDARAGTRGLLVSMDLQNVTGGGAPVEFDLTRATLQWTVTDDKGNGIAPNAAPGTWPGTLLQQRVVVDSRQTVRMPLSLRSQNMPPEKGGYISPVAGGAWTFERGAKARYYLQATLSIPVVPQKGTEIWNGTLELPRVEIPGD